MSKINREEERGRRRSKKETKYKRVPTREVEEYSEFWTEPYSVHHTVQIIIENKRNEIKQMIIIIIRN